MSAEFPKDDVVFMRITPEALLAPERSFGLVLQLSELEGLPSPHHLAAHQQDVLVVYNGLEREFSYSDLLTRLGFQQ